MANKNNNEILDPVINRLLHNIIEERSLVAFLFKEVALKNYNSIKSHPKYKLYLTCEANIEKYIKTLKKFLK